MGTAGLVHDHCFAISVQLFIQRLLHAKAILKNPNFKDKLKFYTSLSKLLNF